MQSRVFLGWLNFPTWRQIKKGAEISKGIFLGKIPRVAIFGRKKKLISPYLEPWVLSCPQYIRGVSKKIWFFL